MFPIWKPWHHIDDEEATVRDHSRNEWKVTARYVGFTSPVNYPHEVCGCYTVKIHYWDGEMFTMCVRGATHRGRTMRCVGSMTGGGRGRSEQ